MHDCDAESCEVTLIHHQSGCCAAWDFLKCACVPPAEPVVLKEEEVPKLAWGSPDVEGLVKFLVEEKGFNEDRVRKAAGKISASKGKGAQGPTTRTPPPPPSHCFCAPMI